MTRRRGLLTYLALWTAEEEPRPIPSKGWAGMIRKVYEVALMAAEESEEYE